jgi:hypothetical protein
LYTDTSNHRIVQTECEDRVFTKVEIIPSVQAGLSALANSLASYLREKMFLLKAKRLRLF